MIRRRSPLDQATARPGPGTVDNPGPGRLCELTVTAAGYDQFKFKFNHRARADWLSLGPGAPMSGPVSGVVRVGLTARASESAC
jgi:hypothetical protein